MPVFASEVAHMAPIHPLIGFVVLAAFAWLVGGRQRPNWRQVGPAIGLQFVLALTIMKTDLGQWVFEVAGRAFNKLFVAYGQAMDFLIGGLNQPSVKTLALSILPMIVFVSALSSVLFHLGILQKLVKLFASVFRRTLGMSGPEAVAASGNIFLGLAEAQTLVGPYLAKMSRAQLFCVMTVGMATVSGALMAFYASLARGFFGGEEGMAAAHLLAASVVSTPAAFLVARLMIPEEASADLVAETDVHVPITTHGFFDALNWGAITGMKLTAYVVAMLIAILGLVHLTNLGLESVQWRVMGPITEDVTVWSLQAGLGWLFAPVAALMGIPQADWATAGQLLGVKVGVNDAVAFMQMSGAEFVSPKSPLILSWALCGFANFGTIGIMIASMVGLCPERRAEISSLGLKAMVAGFIATCLTGAVVATVL